MRTSNNIAARAGRWSARNRKKALAGWLAFIVLAYLGGGAIGTNELSATDSGVGDSGKATKIVADSYPDKVGEMVLVQSRSATTDDPQFRAVVGDLTKSLQSVDGVEHIEGPYDRGDHA